MLLTKWCLTHTHTHTHTNACYTYLHLLTLLTMAPPHPYLHTLTSTSSYVTFTPPHLFTMSPRLELSKLNHELESKLSQLEQERTEFKRREGALEQQAREAGEREKG